MLREFGEKFEDRCKAIASAGTPQCSLISALPVRALNPLSLRVGHASIQSDFAIGYRWLKSSQLGSIATSCASSAKPCVAATLGCLFTHLKP
jgi:hypothetical protein